MIDSPPPALEETPAPRAPIGPEVPLQRCPNCEQPVDGNFCSSCGQRNANPRLTLRQLVREIVGDYLHLDSKLFRTAKVLAFQPGVLTRSYLDGKREGFIRPFKVYLAASVLFFGYAGAHAPQITADESPLTIKVDPEEAGEPAWATKLRKGIENKSADQLTQQVYHALRTYFPKVMFVLLPLFAAILRLLYVRRPFLYVEHFITALHIHAFGYLVMLADSVVHRNISKHVASGFGLMCDLAVLVYVVVALKRVYGQSLVKSGVKAGLALGTYGLCVGVAMGVVSLFAFYFDL